MKASCLHRFQRLLCLDQSRENAPSTVPEVENEVSQEFELGMLDVNGGA